MFTKRHYEAIAGVIKDCDTGKFNKVADEVVMVKSTLVRCLCRIFRNDNPRFDEEKFTQACQ